MDEFSYFLVRVAMPGDEGRAGAVAGVIQRLGTGEDLEFTDAGELLAIVTRWVALPSKMRPPSGSGNDFNGSSET